MRTLVLGLSLPHVTFDNYSFLSAPSLFDYDRVIVEMAAVSEVVEAVVAGGREQKTHGGQPVVNGAGDASSFALAELLRLRRLEAERALARGAAIVCFAYPDVRHEGVAGLAVWRRYDWLPAPEGFSYSEHLLAGHGKLGVEVAEGEHAFAPYVEEFGLRLAYRAYLADLGKEVARHTRVFARSGGGAAVGVELEVGPGKVVLLPPLGSLDYSRDRTPLANVLYTCLERMQAGREEQQSQWVRKEAS